MAESITFQSIIPVLRIFDITKAKEFYVDFLGFEVAWEYNGEGKMPMYMEIKREGTPFHLTEHHGDGTPGSHVRVNVKGIKALHAEFEAKDYKYNKPGIEKTFYGMTEVTVIDPFGNHITFSQPTNEVQDKSTA